MANFGWPWRKTFRVFTNRESDELPGYSKNVIAQFSTISSSMPATNNFKIDNIISLVSEGLSAGYRTVFFENNEAWMSFSSVPTVEIDGVFQQYLIVTGQVHLPVYLNGGIIYIDKTLANDRCTEIPVNTGSTTAVRQNFACYDYENSQGILSSYILGNTQPSTVGVSVRVDTSLGYTVPLSSSVSSNQLFQAFFSYKSPIDSFYVTGYQITINTAEHGSASSSVSTAKEGDTVTVTLAPDSGYEVDVQNTTITSTIGVLPVWDSATQFHFTMPAADVTIQPAFKEVYVPSGYQISVTTVEHGWAEVDKAIDVPGGETVTITFHPDDGYGVDRAVTQVTGGSGPIPISWVNQVEATFVTPSPAPTLGSIIITPAFTDADPYLPGGTSGAGGGGGDFDDHSDPVPIPALPTISVVNSGLVTLFRPSNDQLVSLGNTLWTSWDDFGINLQHIFSNPMDYFIAFNILPCIPAVGTERRIKLGLWESSVSMPPVLSQWYDFDFGQLVVKPYSNTALDYAPNTKITAMLPYIGSVTLNTDEIMGQTLNLRYRIDLLSGSCVAMITVNASVYYQFTGECGVSIPLTGADYSRIYSAVIGAIGTAITGGIAAAGAGAAAAGATTAVAAGNSIARNTTAAANAGAAFSNVTKGVRGAPAMRQLMMEAAQNAVNAGADLAEVPTKVSRGVQAARIANTVNNTVGQVMSGKQLAQHSGTISGSAGMLGTRAAYLMIEYPNQALPEKYRHFVGYPSGMYAKLGSLTGYTECEQVLAAGITGTDEEYAELVECLKGGVYL